MNKRVLSKFLICVAFCCFLYNFAYFVQAEQPSAKYAEQDRHMVDIDRRIDDLKQMVDSKIGDVNDDRKERRQQSNERFNDLRNKFDEMNGRLHFDEGLGTCAWALIMGGQIVIYRKDLKKGN